MRSTTPAVSRVRTSPLVVALGWSLVLAAAALGGGTIRWAYVAALIVACAVAVHRGERLASFDLWTFLGLAVIAVMPACLIQPRDPLFLWGLALLAAPFGLGNAWTWARYGRRMSGLWRGGYAVTYGTFFFFLSRERF